MKASICLSTFNRPGHLRRVLKSIWTQHPSFPFEVIVTDDGSCDPIVAQVCHEFPVTYLRIEREPVYRNPSIGRNAAYRAARGEIVIAQSDEVVHIGSDTIQHLVDDLRPGTFLIATVYNMDENDVNVERRLPIYTGPTNRRPFFFLGSLRREHLYAVGGCSEDFIAPGYDDDWFGHCLMYGLGLRPIFSATIIGHHLRHPYPDNVGALVATSKVLYAQKCRLAQTGKIKWQAQGGPWSYGT